MGRVYLARHTRIAQKRVRSKSYTANLRTAPTFWRAFQREPSRLRRFRTPQRGHVLDIDVTPQGMPYLVCEYRRRRSCRITCAR